MTELYKKQISFTEWFESINHQQTEAMRKEDNDKRERLEVLNQLIQIPFDKATNFEALELAENSPRFQCFLKEHGEELCALRLVPKYPELPKLRMRGHKVKDVMNWFHQQDINPKNYRADVVPHVDSTLWSTIFIVNAHGVFGEIIKGGHHLLTQGFYQDIKPIVFSYDFLSWNISDDEALNHLKGILKKLKVEDPTMKQVLQEKVDAQFSHHYLSGYFETVFSLEQGLWFIDYNRILGKIYQNYSLPIPTSENIKENLNKNIHQNIIKNLNEKIPQNINENRNINLNLKGVDSLTIQGISGSPGKVRGRVRIVAGTESPMFREGEILVCKMTTPEHIHLMQKSSAIITEQGGMLSHAAIVSRELKKPCITGAMNATSTFKDGDLIEVDADNGVVRKLNG